MQMAIQLMLLFGTQTYLLDNWLTNGLFFQDLDSKSQLIGNFCLYLVFTRKQLPTIKKQKVFHTLLTDNITTYLRYTILEVFHRSPRILQGKNYILKHKDSSRKFKCLIMRDAQLAKRKLQMVMLAHANQTMILKYFRYKN